MHGDAPFRITVFDRFFQRVGWIGDPVALTVTPRHNRLPTAQIVLDGEHRMVPALYEPGSRVTVHYHDQLVLSGAARLRQAERTPVEQWTFDIAGDFRLLDSMLGWQVPGAALTAQSSEYRTVTGPAETVVKQLVSENAARLGLPVTVAPSQSRGDFVTAQVRMDKLSDKLLPLVDLAGVGVSVVQSGAGFLLDCYTPQAYPRRLTEQSGVVVDWSLTFTPPTVTRVVVGGPGEGTARKYRSRVDADAEALWQMVIEAHVDARDVDDDANVNANLDARGDAALAEGAARSGLSVTLSETEHFQYGHAVSVGDWVEVEYGSGGRTVADVLREAVLTWTRDDGARALPIVGERSGTERQLADAVADVARRQRILEAGR